MSDDYRKSHFEPPEMNEKIIREALGLGSKTVKGQVDNPFSPGDVERGLILFRTSSNAHGTVGYAEVSERVDALKPDSKRELATLMRNIAQRLHPMDALSTQDPTNDRK